MRHLLEKVRIIVPIPFFLFDLHAVGVIHEIPTIATAINHSESVWSILNTVIIEYELIV